jgi:outer membrane protein OmpA-like peptidoglycan-associated protein
MRPGLMLLPVVLWWTSQPPSSRAAATPTIPLCAGLTIVTAISQEDGDYESIKTIEAVTDKDVRLKYSVERTVSDLFSAEPPHLEKYTINRTIRREDLASAKLYLQQFSTELPELVPGTTAIGTSAAVLNDLKTKGAAEMGIFITFTQNKPPIDTNEHPNVYDNAMVAEVRRVGTVKVPVLVNGAHVELPAVQAAGDFFGDRSEFFFLDDAANPLTLRFRFGIGGISDAELEVAREVAKLNGTRMVRTPDKDTLEVVKISYKCSAQPDAPEAAGAGPGGLERSLADSGRAEVYDIYFTFNSDQIRQESEPTLKEIAAILGRHPDWKLSVEGHTDGIASDSYNLDLSRKRAAAVKTALVTRYGTAEGRLTTAGFGKTRPKDTNDTLAGRARNRRVELVRVP